MTSNSGCGVFFLDLAAYLLYATLCMPKAVVQIPRKVLRDVVEAGRHFREAEDALEDFLLATDAPFLKKMRHLRLQHRRGWLGDWQKLKARYGL